MTEARRKRGQGILTCGIYRPLEESHVSFIGVKVGRFDFKCGYWFKTPGRHFRLMTPKFQKVKGFHFDFWRFSVGLMMQRMPKKRGQLPEGF